MINKSRCNSKSYQKKKKRNLEKKQVTKRVQSFFLIYTGVGRAKGHYSIGQ